MKSAAAFSIASIALLTSVFASELKVVNFENLQLKPRTRTSSIKFAEGRATTNQIALSNRQNLYAINLKVGTPAQNISVQIDTGSSDLWFPVTGSDLCNLQSSECTTFGSYDTRSSTLKNLRQTFSISYVDGTKIRGTFVTDNIKVGDASLQAVEFAACNSGSSDTGVQGILGVGYEVNEAPAAKGGATYPNMLRSMVQQGAINTLAYSMWLNDPNSAEGNVLFGGVDLAKFTGTLISMPVVPDTTGAYSALSMPLTGISFSAGGLSFSFTSATFVSPAVIDSGTTLMYLPDDIVLALYKSLGVQVASQVATLPCTSGKDQSAKMTFVFNGPNGAKIDIRLADLLLQMNDKNGKVSDTCEFLVSGGAPDGLILLGDSFMRSAYLVYDLQNNKIAIAQAKYNESTTNIKEINSDGIPSASVMSTLVSGASFAPAASSSLLGGNPTRSATGTGSGGVETTAPIPSFTLTPGRNAAPLSAAQVPVMSIVGVVVGTLTVLSVFGGAMVVWF